MQQKRLAHPALTSLLMALGCATAWPITDAPAPVAETPEATAEPSGERPPAEEAKVAYNQGLELLQQADAAPMEQARSFYLRARKQFDEATRLAPEMAEAWNATGYAQRKLGNYEAALAAYDLALTLKPGYPQALEYRGEAYLALNRIADARQAYLDLFASDRTIASQLLAAMKNWVATRRENPAGVERATIEETAQWIEERSQIAAQTAALTRDGAAAAGWR